MIIRSGIGDGAISAAGRQTPGRAGPRRTPPPASPHFHLRREKLVFITYRPNRFSRSPFQFPGPPRRLHSPRRRQQPITAERLPTELSVTHNRFPNIKSFAFCFMNLIKYLNVMKNRERGTGRQRHISSFSHSLNQKNYYCYCCLVIL